MENHRSPLAMLEYEMKQDSMTNNCSANVNEHVANTERLVEKLRDAMEQTEVANNNSEELISEEETERKLLEKLQFELAAKERQIAALVLETQKLQSTLMKATETSFSQISDLEDVVNGKAKLIAQLESKLQSQADYEEIKRELSRLQSMANDDQTSKTFLEQNRPIKIEQIKLSSHNDSESNTNLQQAQYSSRHCTSPCLHRSNAPFFPVPSLLLSSSSSSNSSSSPSSPSQIYSKTHSTMNGNTNEDLTRSITESAATTTAKFISPSSLSIITSKDNLDLCNSLSSSKYPSIASSCSTMVTPTASLLSSVTMTTPTLTPSNLFSGQQLSSVQCTKLHCPPTSSWSPPLSSSSGVSSIATTSTDNRTVIKLSKPTSPKPSSSPTILVPSTCPPIISTNNNNNSLLEPLDTNYVATVVRKLLAQHNIGQRIFARYILSLSQGTVSELLSKPKCWTKLTEKGKESYRKMWCWANSEKSILALKSISPRKGMNNRSKDNPYPAVSTKHTDPATHQRIVQILADAQKQQMAAAIAASASASASASANMDQKLSLSPCSSLPNDLSNPILYSDPLESKSPSSSSTTSTANSPLNESTPTDLKSFLLPLPPPPPPPPSSSTAAAASLSMLSAFVPSLLMRTANGLNTDTGPTSGNLMNCPASSPFSLLNHQPDNYRNWLMLQEIVRNNDLLKQFQPTFPPFPPLSRADTDNETEEDNDDEDEEEENNSDTDDDFDEENPTSSDEIPLDLSMKIDANHSDLDQPSVTIPNKQPQHSATKQVKTALAPLREQDISKYRYVNTMELVQTVKDILSRYSISQRHFGEKILGLSQGSVSDILARPKQWELLTQKGREPFLRMRIFLDDPNAIKQLVQTVSTTIPTTTNTSSILLPTFCPPLPPPPTSLPSSLLTTPSLLSNVTLNGFHPTSLLTRDNSTDSQSNLLVNDSTQILLNESMQPLPPTSSSSPSNGIPTNANKSKSRSRNRKTATDKPSNQSRSSSANPLMTPYELPKIVLPSTIDTEQLSSQVRELLFAYSIGQRVFGEAVLNLSQGTVSEILSKPRPWQSLSVKGREPYIRMYTWYNDTNNVQKLLAWKRERDALRRSRPPAPTPAITDNGDNESGNNNSIVTDSSSTTHRPKRRCLFSDDQRRVLKQIFENEPYPSQSTLEQLVGELALPMNKIANWFHNSRMRAKTSLRPPSISASSLNNHDVQSDEEDDLDDNNNNNNNDVDDEDEDDYSILPTIVPLTSSWLNGTTDSNSSSSPTGFFSTPTNIVSLIDDQKLPPISSSSSKKRKSVPQKLVSNPPPAKKFHQNSPVLETDSNDETPQTTNEPTHFVDILT